VKAGFKLARESLRFTALIDKISLKTMEARLAKAKIWFEQLLKDIEVK
jgi:hypothetical protein